MRTLIKAEYLKQKHSFTNKAEIVAPILVLIMVLVLTGGAYNAFSPGAWNWWYTMFLPGTLAICCHQIVQKDKKKKYHTVFTLPLSTKKIWISKIMLGSIYLFIGNVVLGIGSIIGGLLMGTYISVTMNILAVFVLTLTYLWEIPVYMFLSAKAGMFASVCTGIVMAIVGTVFAPTKLWWALIFAMPMRAMCPVITVMPNGLPVEAGSYFLDYSCLRIILPVTLIAFLVCSFLTAGWFSKREEK